VVVQVPRATLLAGIHLGGVNEVGAMNHK